MQVSPTLRKSETGHHWFCPACKTMHPLPNSWQFDGNLEKPTFSPSFKHDWHNGHICHYFIQQGNVMYCGDCTHAMAGQTVEMPVLTGNEEYGMPMSDGSGN